MPTQRTARVGLQVWLDAPEICERIQIGTLYPNMQQTGLAPPFAYTEDWLGNRNCFMLDPRLDLYVGEQHPASERGFGVFLDSAPDRWGSKLIQRREVLKAKAVQRSPKLLSGLELMLGVHDFTRSGALRFCYPGGNFLDDDTTYAVPPVTSLKTLSAIALELDDDNAEDKPEYEHWLSILVAPGSSLGGARPKAVFAERDHSLWLAKFPGRNDTHDWGLWEYLTHQLARKAGIDVPESELLSFGKGDHTFCVKRFDRGIGENPAARRMYTSAMTLLTRNDGDGGSYLDLVLILEDHGGTGLTQDLHQLFRRAVFNLLMGNRDDHLRNHGFIYTGGGWRLSPAFDMNPYPAKNGHALTWDEISAEPDFTTLWNTYPQYRLEHAQAQTILDEVLAVVETWRTAAEKLGARQSEIEMMDRVIQAHP